MKHKSSRLENLKKKEAQLKAKIQKLESLEKSRERKQDTRRKILIGSYFIHQAKQEGRLDELYQQLHQYIKRDNDKELFPLTPLSSVDEV